MTAQKLRLGIRFMLKHNRNDELRNIEQATSTKNIPLDSLINEQQTKSAAMTSLESQHREVATQRRSSLKIQGKSFNSIKEAFDEKTINSWSTMINDLLPERLFLFVRKAFQQQLPTASNWFRWKKTDSNKCRFRLHICINISNKLLVICMLGWNFK